MEESDIKRKIAALLDLFDERMYLAIYIAQCRKRPSNELFNLLADGIPPFPYRFSFEGMGVNEIINRAASLIGVEDEAEKLMDFVDEVLYELNERDAKRPTKKMIEKLLQLRHDVLRFFEEKGYKPNKRAPDPVVC